MAKLEGLNPEGEAERPKEQLDAGGLGKDGAHTKEYHERPQSISWILTQEGRKNLRETSRCEASHKRSGEREQIPDSLSESSF
jgi:hypothetical protein